MRNVTQYYYRAKTYRTEITDLFKWHLFSGVKPMPRFASGTYSLILAIKSDLHLARSVDILVYVVTPKRVCPCGERDAVVLVAQICDVFDEVHILDHML